ncbi:MAG: hypothetical protein WA133_11885 [Syntrophales bacterium]
MVEEQVKAQQAADPPVRQPPAPLAELAEARRQVAAGSQFFIAK